MTAYEAITSIREDIDRLERKQVVKPGHIARRRAEVAAIENELHAMQTAVDRVEFAQADAQRAQRNAEEQYQRLRQWCEIYGMDLHQFDSMPPSWQRHLPRAVITAHQVRIADGLHDEHGVRFARAYRNPDAFAYHVLSATALEHDLRNLCQRTGMPLPPTDLPLALWPAQTA